MSTGRLGAGDNAIQSTLIDAKGDLVTATAADTPARLAVGSNNQTLLADSAQSTGIKWGSSPQSLMTATGDLLYASSANTPARLAIGSTDQVLKVSGGVPAWGAAPSPTAAGASVANTASQNTTSGAYTTLTFDKEYFDTDNFHSTSTNTSRFTIPSGLAGKYLVMFQAFWNPVMNVTSTVKFQVNGSDNRRALTYVQGASSYSGTMFNSAFLNLAVGDYVEILFYQDTGSTKAVTTDEYGHFSIIRIGA